MDNIKETCKSVPAFLNFLKNKEYDREAKQSLYHLMCKPLEYVPNLVVLTETLLNETPFPHQDRLPLQMALTHLECLCENLTNQRIDIEMKEKVKYLDSQCIGLEKELASSARYFIRHDNMLLCESEHGKLVKTKAYEIFMLNDVIVCASKMSKRQQVQLMTNKVYKVKWCFPICDINIVDATSGIYINMEEEEDSDANSHRVISGQYPSKYVEDLLHDLTMIGDIMGKVSSLRLSYSFIDSNKVNEWYKEVHKRLDGVMEMANMNWIEISIPSGNKGEREELLFNVPSPQTKLEWSIEFENINLLSTGDNNPGWYIPEESVYDGEVVNLRRALPLVAGIQPLFMVNPETSVDCVLDATAATSPSKPILWIFSGNERLGVITLLEMSISSVPHVLHSYVACNERICCAEMVTKKVEIESVESVFVWVGTLSGRIMVYNALDINERQPLTSTSLDDSVVSMKFTRNGVFVGLANGSLLRFDIETGVTWNLRNPTIVSLSLFPIISISESCEKLWCASGSVIHIVDKESMLTEEQVSTSEDDKKNIKQLISYGIGVWVSLRKSTILLLYHGETKQQLQIINTATSITRMKNEMEGPIRNICTDNMYVTTLLAKQGLLWVGVDQGLIVTYPLPKLGGIPTVSGKACVSFHAHGDCVKYIHAFSLRRSFRSETVDPLQDEDDDGDDEGITASGRNSTQSHLYQGSIGNESDAQINEEPEYFILERESEPGSETGSSDETDVRDETNELKNTASGNENDKLKNYCSRSSGTLEQSNAKKSCSSRKGRVKNAINISKDQYNSDSEISPDQDFCFIEKEMADSPTELGRKPSVDQLTTNIPFLGNDGFANTMEKFDGFNEVLSRGNWHTNAEKDASHLVSNEVAHVTSSSERNNEASAGSAGITCEEENTEGDECQVVVTEQVLQHKHFVDGKSKSDIPTKVEIPLTFPTRRRDRKQKGGKGVELPSAVVDNQKSNALENSKDVRGEVRENSCVVDGLGECDGLTKVNVDDLLSSTVEDDRGTRLTEDVTENSNMVEGKNKNDIPTKVEIPLTFPTRKCNRIQNGGKLPPVVDNQILNTTEKESPKDLTEKVRENSTVVDVLGKCDGVTKIDVDDAQSAVGNDTGTLVSEEVTENSNMVEEQGKNDIPTKVEIPLTFPTRRRDRKLKGVQGGANVTDCGNDSNLDPIKESGSKVTDNSLVETTNQLPASFFVQGESFSAYDVKQKNQSDNVSIDDVIPNTSESTLVNPGEEPMYEVPLKVISNDLYATLESTKEQHLRINGCSSNETVDLRKTTSARESRSASLPISSNVNKSQKSKKRTSFATSSRNNSSYFPPLHQKGNRSSKDSKLLFTNEESRSDLEKKSWYVVSIGRGHTDLRKGSKYNEDLNLLNSTSYEGREPMLMLWKLNAGNSVFFME